MAANTALRPASASAIPFQSDTACTRRLPHGDMVVEREADGLRQGVGRKLHQLAGRQRDRRQAQHRNVPAAGAEAEVEGVDQPAVDLVGESDRGDELRGARPLGLRRARETGRDVIARMPGNAPDIGVIEVEIAEGGAIGERRKIGRDAPRGADDSHATAAARQRHAAANAHRLFVEGREPATERVDEMHFDPLDGCVIEVVIAQTVRVGGEPFRQRRVTPLPVTVLPDDRPPLQRVMRR